MKKKKKIDVEDKSQDSYSSTTTSASNSLVSALFLGSDQGFPSGLLNVNEGPRDSLYGVNGSLIMIQGFVVLKEV